MLRGAPGIEDRNLVHAGNGAMRGTAFFGEILATDIGNCVFFQRDAGIPPLLRAVMHQPILADVEVARSGAATPLVRTSLGNVVLEGIDTGEAAPLQGLHLVIDAALFIAKRLQLAFPVMNNANRRAETEFHGPPADGQRVLGIAYAAADNGVDVHVEV